MLAAEGLFALTLPLVIGPWSDTFQTPLGRRRPFMLVALGPIGFCLALMAFMPSLWMTALIVLAFFFAYYVYEPPYRGLYPDLLPERLFGRAQGVQHLLRGLALGIALIGGGRSSTSGSRPRSWSRRSSSSPRARRRSSSCARTAATAASSRASAPTSRTAGASSAASRRCGGSWSQLGWEGTFAGARTFVVLYITVGLGQPLGDDDRGARDGRRRLHRRGGSARACSATASGSRA